MLDQHCARSTVTRSIRFGRTVQSETRVQHTAAVICVPAHSPGPIGNRRRLAAPARSVKVPVAGFGMLSVIFSRPPQARRIRRPLFLFFLRLFFFSLSRLRQYDFLLRAHDLLAAHPHGLHPHHFVPTMRTKSTSAGGSP